MADISQYTHNILTAARGEVVRDSIVDAIKTIDDGTEYAEYLDGHRATDFITYVDEVEKLDCDREPTENSPRPVESNWFYNNIGDIFDIGSVTEDQLLGKILLLDNISQDILDALNTKLDDANMPTIPYYTDENDNKIYYYPWMYIAPAIQALYNRKYIALNVVRNGVYEAAEGTAYSSITVNVRPTDPMPFSGTITQNGTYYPPDGYHYTSVTVEVPPQPFSYSYNRSTGVANAQGLFYAPHEQEEPHG